MLLLSTCDLPLHNKVRKYFLQALSLQFFLERQLVQAPSRIYESHIKMVCVCVCVCRCMRALHASMHACMRVCMRACMRARMRVCAHPYFRSCARASMRASVFCPCVPQKLAGVRASRRGWVFDGGRAGMCSVRAGMLAIPPTLGGARSSYTAT